jgi:hypothetical protein
MAAASPFDHNSDVEGSGSSSREGICYMILDDADFFAVLASGSRTFTFLPSSGEGY